MRRVVIMGAAGRDFHTFNVVFRDDPAVEVVAFTAAQIPGIDHRVYPASLAGVRYPEGIPIRPEAELDDLCARHAVDEVVFAYSDVAYDDVMHASARALAAGADFRIVGPRASMVRATKPVIAVSASRTGAGKSQTSRRIAHLVLDAGLRVALVRHPMPYGDLEAMRAQRFVTLADLDRAGPTIEEREEYELPLEMGVVVHTGVDYAEIIAAAARDADVILWDGGNNDFPFVVPDLMITVVDALRPGHELRFHPGEVNVRMADVVVVNKVDAAEPDAIAAVLANVAALNPDAVVVSARSPVTLEPGPPLAGRPVLVIDDGPTLTHGGMPFGAGTVAALAAGAVPVDPRPVAVGSLVDTFARYPGIGAVLPAMGYDPGQLADLGATARAVACDAVLVGSPVDLARLVDLGHPARRVRYELAEVGHPTLADVVAPILARARGLSSPH